jgi:predicted Zn-dependent protease
MKRILSLFAGTVLFISACTTNAVTGRKQLSLISESALQEEAVSQYRSFLNQNRVVNESSSRDAEMVRRVGSRIASAITQYYNSQGKRDVLAGYNWEFNLVDNKEVNAWCMPGGKVVVYTGLFTVVQNEAQLAIVLGHEITHAVAHHGQERISQAMLAQGIGVAGGAVFGNSQAGNIFNNVYGPAASVGVLLPNSRNQELEADHYGLIFAAMAGYNPQEAIPFWTRMANMASSAAKPPVFLSTHPADAQRIQKIKSYMPEALRYYKPMSR